MAGVEGKGERGAAVGTPLYVDDGKKMEGCA